MLKVKMYRYLGIHIGCSGGWLHHFRHMAAKIKSKTGEIIGWARRYDIPLPLMARVWEIYVRHASLHGAAIACPPPHCVELMDRAQRQAGRMMLSFRKQIPGPAVLAELGWTSISLDLTYARAGFLGRICQVTNLYVQTMVEMTAANPRSWIASTVRLVRPWCGNITPDQTNTWSKLIRTSKTHAQKQEASCMAHLCLRYSSIASHSIPKWRCEGRWAANNFLYCKELKPSTSRSIARLIVGGQDLRGGDPTCDEHPSRINCCVPCLESHRYHAETVQPALSAPPS